MKKMVMGLKFYWNAVRFPGAVALGNELAGMFDHARETLQVDPVITLPVVSKYLVYERGSNIHYAKPSAGTNSIFDI